MNVQLQKNTLAWQKPTPVGSSNDHPKSNNSSDIVLADPYSESNKSSDFVLHTVSVPVPSSYYDYIMSWAGNNMEIIQASLTQDGVQCHDLTGDLHALSGAFILVAEHCTSDIHKNGVYLVLHALKGVACQLGLVCQSHTSNQLQDIFIKLDEVIGEAPRYLAAIAARLKYYIMALDGTYHEAHVIQKIIKVLSNYIPVLKRDMLSVHQGHTTEFHLQPKGTARPTLLSIQTELQYLLKPQWAPPETRMTAIQQAQGPIPDQVPTSSPQPPIPGEFPQVTPTQRHKEEPQPVSVQSSPPPAPKKKKGGRRKKAAPKKGVQASPSKGLKKPTAKKAATTKKAKAAAPKGGSRRRKSLRLGNSTPDQASLPAPVEVSASP